MGRRVIALRRVLAPGTKKRRNGEPRCDGLEVQRSDQPSPHLPYMGGINHQNMRGLHRFTVVFSDCFTGQSLIQSLPKKGQLYGDLACTGLIWRLIQQISSQGLATYGVFKKREVTFLCMKLALFGWKSRVLSPWTCLIHSNTKSSCHDSKSPIPKSADETGLAMLIFGACTRATQHFVAWLVWCSFKRGAASGQKAQTRALGIQTNGIPFTRHRYVETACLESERKEWEVGQKFILRHLQTYFLFR